MAGAKLATAYYELIASTPGAQQQIAKGLIPAAQKAGDKAGKSISDALGRGAEGGGNRAGAQAGAGFAKAVESSSSRVSSIGSGLGKALGSGLTAAATAAVSGGAAVLGTALTAGFNRLNSIDTAKAKLRGLGNDAESVAAIMKNATAAVKGTAFGLDAAATVAASAVASGIKPGEQLQGVLTTIANVAAAAGTSMDEMGAIFNKAAGAGRADTEVMNQLADRGIPIWQKLAEVYNTNAVGVRKMASDGKISFEDFAAAAASAAGNVASEMGNTVPGAIANMKASIGRIGAGLLSGIFPNIAPQVQLLTASLAPLEEKAKTIGESIGKKIEPAMTKLSNAMTKLTSGSSGLGAKLKELSPILGPLGGAFAALGAGGLATLATRIPVLSSALPGLGLAASALTGPFGLLAAAFAGLAATSKPLRDALSGLGKGVFDSLKAAGTQLQPVFAALTPILIRLSNIIAGALSIAIQQLTPILTSLAPVIGQIIALLTGALADILPVIGQIIIAMMPVVTTIIGLLSKLIAAILPPILEIITQLTPIITQIVNLLADTLMAVLPTITDLITQLTPVLSQIASLISGALAVALPIISSLIEAMTPVIQTIVDLLTQMIGAVLPPLISFLTELWPVVELGMELFKKLGEALAEILPYLGQLASEVLPIMGPAFNLFVIPAIQMFIAVLKLAIPVVEFLLSVLIKITDYVKNVFSTNWGAEWAKAKHNVGVAIDFIGTKIDQAIEWFRSIPSKIKSAFSDAPNLRKNAGKLIIDGFLSGLKGAFENVKSFVGSIGGWIAAHKGPKAYDLALLVPAGGWIMTGLQEGLRSAIPDLTRTIEGITSGIQSDFEIGARLTGRDLGGASAEATSATPIAAPSPTINITNHYPTAQPEWKERNDVAQGIRLALA